MDSKGKLYIGYDYILFIANLVEQGSTLFFRYVHHLYEHVSLLKERIEYTKSYIDFDELYINAFNNQVIMLSKIRAKALKLDITIKEYPQALKKAELYELASSIREYAKNIRCLIVRWAKLLGLDIE